MCFAGEISWYNIAGRHLDLNFLENPLRLADEPFTLAFSPIGIGQCEGPWRTSFGE